MSEQDESEKGFKIKDKRRFTAEGEVRGESAEAPKVPEPSGPEGPSHAEPESPAIDCISFFISLASSAQFHLGLIPEPGSGKKIKNLGLAKQTIDLLEMLEAKTKGNLTEEEAKVLQHLLYELRLQFVEAKK